MHMLRRTYVGQVKVGGQDECDAMLETMYHVAFGMAVTDLEIT